MWTRPGLARHGVGVEHAAVLAWASQLAGMEVPGRSALVGGIDADFEQAPARGVFAARAVLADVDTRFRSVRLTGEVTAGHTTATVEVRSFSRREFGAPDTGLLRDLLGPDTLGPGRSPAVPPWCAAAAVAWVPRSCRHSPWPAPPFT